MAIDPVALKARVFAPVEQSYDRFDTIRYGLSLGIGSDPLDPGELRHVYEDGLQAMPTMINILGFPGFWAKEPDTGIDWRRLVHAEQAFVLHRPVPPEGRIVGHTRVADLWDKGAGRGTMMSQERRVVDTADDTLLATVTQLTYLRGDGGWSDGEATGAPPPPHALPDRTPDATCDLPTSPGAALLYRLNGDHNPLHADPAVAAAAGFPRPILHGLCTMGMACHAVLRTMLDYRTDAITGMRVRFTAPVYPGETLRTAMWRDGDIVSLRTTAVERDVVVLDAGRVDLSSSIYGI